MSMIDDMRSDTEAIVSDWEEVFAVNRLTSSYDDERMPVDSYSANGSFAGDYQPADADLMRAEEGLKYRSQAVIYAPSTADVAENDQVTRTDGSIWYVNYTRVHEDHTEIYLRRTEGQVT